MKPGPLKSCLFLALAIAFLTLIAVWIAKLTTPTFRVGTPLPPGKVQPQLVAWQDLIVLLAPDGSLWAWGGEWAECFGRFFSTPVAPTRPQRIGTDTDWRRVATTGHVILGIRADGSLWGLGVNDFSLLQAPLRGPFHSPLRIGAETNWLEVVAGGGHVLGLKGNGSLWSWGLNLHGQIGLGITNQAISMITQVGTNLDWISIACGPVSSYALKRNGTLWGWGKDMIRNQSIGLEPVQLDNTTNCAAIVVDYFDVMRLHTDGTIWSMGSAPFSSSRTNLTQVGKDMDWKEIVSGRSIFFARKEDGNWWVCGENNHRFADPRTPLLTKTPVKMTIPLATWAMAASGCSVVVLAPDGKLWTWGLRPGALAPITKFSPLINLMNEASREALGRELLSFGINEDSFPRDDSPQLIWELPPSVTRALGTNAPIPPKPAP